jgi:hypothetical protein
MFSPNGQTVLPGTESDSSEADTTDSDFGKGSGPSSRKPKTKKVKKARTDKGKQSKQGLPANPMTFGLPLPAAPEFTKAKDALERCIGAYTQDKLWGVKQKTRQITKDMAELNSLSGKLSSTGSDEQSRQLSHECFEFAEKTTAMWELFVFMKTQGSLKFFSAFSNPQEQVLSILASPTLGSIFTKIAADLIGNFEKDQVDVFFKFCDGAECVGSLAIGNRLFDLGNSAALQHSFFQMWYDKLMRTTHQKKFREAIQALGLRNLDASQIIQVKSGDAGPLTAEKCDNSNFSVLFTLEAMALRAMAMDFDVIQPREKQFCKDVSDLRPFMSIRFQAAIKGGVAMAKILWDKVVEVSATIMDKPAVQDFK